MNVHEEKTADSLWKKLGDVYQGKSLVNKLFPRKKLYSLKMDEGTGVADHLNALNMVIAQLTSVGVSVSEEEHCMLLLCSLLDSWDHLVMAIGSTTTQLKMDEVVATHLSEEIQRKSSKVAKEALITQLRAKDKAGRRKKTGTWSLNLVGESPKQSVGTAGKLVISERIAKRRRRRRQGIVLLTLSLLKVMKKMSVVLLWLTGHLDDD